MVAATLDERVHRVAVGGDLRGDDGAVVVVCLHRLCYDDGPAAPECANRFAHVVDA